ncbi:MAG TPA: cobyrinic acid a,c-diamide synthase, partial [Afipia sp.]|nr:cobyrinic acid a,c-diamide synthase [Afipia sp.]
RETAETLADHDPPVLRTAIGQRVIYADAAQSGRLAFEIDDDGPAAR